MGETAADYRPNRILVAAEKIRMTAVTPPMGLHLLLVYEEVVEMVDNGWTSESPVLVLDVRSPPEVEQHGTIPGALNINVRTLEDTLALCQEDFENQVGVPRKKLEASLLVLFCRSGPRAVRAAKILEAHKISSKIYSGGLLDWVACGGGVQRANMVC